MRHISIADSVRIVDLRKKEHSYRSIEMKIGIPKSTVNYNIDSITQSVLALEQTNKLCNKVFLVRAVLVCSMDGGTSTRRISTLIKNIWDADVSHQTVQVILEESEKIAHKSNKALSLEHVVCGLFDEVFQNRKPILAFADPISGLIMLAKSEGRTKEEWISFLEKLKEQELDPETTNTDGAKALLKAIKEVFKDATSLRDAFHVLQKLTKARRKMEGYCYRLLHTFEEMLKNTAVTLEELLCFEDKQNLAIDLFDDFEILLADFHKGLLFSNDSENGEYLNSTKLGWILKKLYRKIYLFSKKVCNHPAIIAACTYIKNGFRAIVSYKKFIEDKISKRSSGFIKDFVMSYFMKMSEYIDNYLKAYENKVKQEYWGEKIATLRRETRNSTCFNDEEIDNCINEFWDIYRETPKSNSYIEAVNSVIRTYLNTYKSIPSWFCSLFTFYWNNRVFQRGKRKGHSPCELVSQKELVNKQKWFEPILKDFPYHKIHCSLQSELAYAA